MTAALQEPSNWPRIRRAAKEAPEAIAKMEAEMGISPAGKIGGMEAVSRGTAEKVLGEELPEHIPPMKQRTYTLDAWQMIRQELRQMEQLTVAAARYAHDSDIDGALREVYLKARAIIEKIDRGKFR